MQESLLNAEQRYSSQIDPQPYEEHKEKVTFRDCISIVEGHGVYQKRIFILLAFFWVVASFFLAMSFYLFKKPDYIGCKCKQNDNQCIEKLCQASNQVPIFVNPQNTLTYYFGLFCEYQWARVLLKIAPQCLSGLGFLFYGKLADVKGRKTAMKISWRLYTGGIIVFSTTQTMFLRIVGYAIACFHCYPALFFTFILVFEQNTERTRNRVVLLLWSALFVGPIVLSFISKIIFTMNSTTNQPQLTIRWILIIFCAIPALIASIVGNQICQSAIFAYPTNKIYAFNILNYIAKMNKQLPILIDMSRSSWRKYKNSLYIPFSQYLKEYPWNLKLLLGCVMMFLIYFNIKLSQTQLDIFTDSYIRIRLINGATALADITLCLFITKIKRRSCKILFIINIIMLIARLVLISFYGNQLDNQFYKYSMIICALLLRYSSQLAYGLLLIWTIQTFPTIFRARSIGIIMFGSSLSCTVVYLIRGYTIIASAISIVLTILGIFFQKYLQLNAPSQTKLPDTIKGQKFDNNDSFYKFS